MNDGYRKAALKLHAMSAADRNWMLQRLEPTQRSQLTALLRELHQLGIKADREISEHLSADEAGQRLLEAVGEPTAVARALDDLCVANVVWITSLLSTESDHITAAVLSAYPWPWRAQFLAECSVEQRQRLNTVLQQESRIKPRAQAELVRLLAERFAEIRHRDDFAVSVTTDMGRRSGRWGGVSTLWQELRRWLP